MKIIHLMFTVVLLTNLCVAAETNAVKLSGPQLKACVAALNHFSAHEKKAELDHYTIEVFTATDHFNVSFSPDAPSGEHIPRGGSTKFGPAVNYVISKDNYKIKEITYGR